MKVPLHFVTSQMACFLFAKVEPSNSNQRRNQTSIFCCADYAETETQIIVGSFEKCLLLCFWLYDATSTFWGHFIFQTIKQEPAKHKITFKSRQMYGHKLLVTSISPSCPPVWFPADSFLSIPFSVALLRCGFPAAAVASHSASTPLTYVCRNSPPSWQPPPPLSLQSSTERPGMIISSLRTPLFWNIVQGEKMRPKCQDGTQPIFVDCHGEPRPGVDVVVGGKENISNMERGVSNLFQNISDWVFWEAARDSQPRVSTTVGNDPGTGRRSRSCLHAPGSVVRTTPISCCAAGTRQTASRWIFFFSPPPFREGYLCPPGE